MRKVSIQDLSPGLVNGIEVQMPGVGHIQKEKYFEWEPSSLITQFNTNLVSGGILTSYRHEPIFNEVESHVDAEMFYFISGIALMLFIDIVAGKPNFKTAQIVRIPQNTQIIILAGKGHFVPVPEGDSPISIVVVAPQMGDISCKLHQSIIGY